MDGLDGDLIERFSADLHGNKCIYFCFLEFCVIPSLFVTMLTCLCLSFIDNMGKMKIFFFAKVNLRAIVMAHLAEKVEKEPTRGVVLSPSEDKGLGPVVTKVDPITVVEPTVIESEDSTESMRFVTHKPHRFGKCYELCLCFWRFCMSFSDFSYLCCS